MTKRRLTLTTYQVFSDSWLRLRARIVGSDISQPENVSHSDAKFEPSRCLRSLRFGDSRFKLGGMQTLRLTSAGIRVRDCADQEHFSTMATGRSDNRIMARPHRKWRSTTNSRVWKPAARGWRWRDQHQGERAPAQYFPTLR